MEGEHQSPLGLTLSRPLQTSLPPSTSSASQRLLPGRCWCRKLMSCWSLTGRCIWWTSCPCQEKLPENQGLLWRGRTSWRLPMGWLNSGGEPAAPSAWPNLTPGQAGSAWLNENLEIVLIIVTTTPGRHWFPGYSLLLSCPVSTDSSIGD